MAPALCTLHSAWQHDAASDATCVDPIAKLTRTTACEFQSEASHLQANVPLSEMFQYVSNLRGMTKGRAQYSMQLEKYEVVPPQVSYRCWCSQHGFALL